MTNHLECDKLLKSPKGNGSIAQLGEHLPYKQRVIGSSPIVSTNGPVAQLVRALACHARGQGFESPRNRHLSESSESANAAGCKPVSFGSSWIDTNLAHHFVMETEVFYRLIRIK